MPRYSTNKVIQQGMKRYFLQNGGPGPANDVLYGGTNAQYMNIESVSNPISGGRTPINVQDPRRNGQFVRVGNENSPSDFPTATVQFIEQQGYVPKSLYDLGRCRTNFYEQNGICGDPGDFINGWDFYVKIFSGGEATDNTEGGGSFDADAAVMDDMDFTFDDVYPVGKLGFGEKATVQVYSEVIDIVYGDRESCKNCGPDDDGTKLIYAVTNNTVASAGEAPSVVYTVDGGANWTELAITGAASTDVPKAIDIVGNQLVVLYDDSAGGGYFVTNINRITGVPNSSWTQVTTGFVSTKEPQDMYVESPGAIWFCGDGGYIYKSTSILSGVTAVNQGDTTTNNLSRIDGVGETIVAVGASATVIYSDNGGKSFATADNAPGAAALTALAVVDDFVWWVGNSSGAVYYSDKQGQAAWTQATLPAASTALATIQDIYFATDEVGYISAASSGPAAFLYSTWNGGYSWAVSSNAPTPRIQGYPTFDRGNRLAAPLGAVKPIAANNLAVAGLAGNGSDGIILVGTAGVR